MFVAGRPHCRLVRVELGDLPAGDHPFADSAVFPDRGQIGEQVSDGVAIPNGPPRGCPGRVGVHWDHSPLVAALTVGHRLRADMWSELLESGVVGSRCAPTDIRVDGA